jgi:uncharacterized protein (DUF342 family)
MKPYTITIADNDMEAWICFHSDASLPLERLHHDIAEAGVVDGIDWFLVQDLAEAHQPGQCYRIALGIPPEEGVEYFFSRNHDRSPKRLPDGRVDFYNLNAIQNVVQQQILVAKIPPEACKAGRTVTGKEIPASQREVPLPKAGMNVAVTEDGHTLIALINGHPVLADNCLRVEPTYTLDGNVDFSVGNITCIGHLVITGDVKSGFSVKGAQDVTVYGVVDGGEIDAVGSIYLYGNVFGKQTSRIRSTRYIKGIYIDSSIVEANKDIVLTRGARQSVLSAGGSILAPGDGTAIMGGTARASERIVAHDLGSEGEIATRIEILSGAFDETTCLRFLHHIAVILETDSAWLVKEFDSQEFPESLETMQQTSHDCLVALPHFVRYFTNRQQIHRPAPMPLGTVIAKGTVYPGVTICIGGASLLLTQPMTQVMFSQTDGVIQVQSLDHIDRAVPRVE